jgi:hypothetical protein
MELDGRIIIWTIGFMWVVGSGCILIDLIFPQKTETVPQIRRYVRPTYPEPIIDDKEIGSFIEENSTPEPQASVILDDSFAVSDDLLDESSILENNDLQLNFDDFQFDGDSLT